MPPWRSPGAPERDSLRGLAADFKDSQQPEWAEEYVDLPALVQASWS